MSGRGTTGKPCAPDGAGARPDLIAACCEGLGLAAIAAIRGSAGIRIVAPAQGEGGAIGATEAVEARWWCRRAEGAERVAAAASARLRRGDPSADAFAAAQTAAPTAFMRASEAIANAARRLCVVLHTDEEIVAQAARIIARVDAEFERLQRSGDMKSVNKAYRAYRIERSARNEKVVPYAEWMSKYKANLVRELACALRYN